MRRPVQRPGARRWLSAVLLSSLLCGVARGFLLAPAGGGGDHLVRQGLGDYRCSAQRSAQPTARRSPTSGVVCRMADAAAEREAGEEAQGSEHSVSSPPTPLGAGGDGDGAGIDLEDEEALWRMFPNMPEPPTPVLQDPRKLTMEQLSEGEDEVSYGGQPSARRAIEDFERSERNRLHIATAKRVLTLNQGGVTLVDDGVQGRTRFDPPSRRGQAVADPDEGLTEAMYPWDKHPKLVTFSAFGVLYNWVVPLGALLRDALTRAHHFALRLPSPQAFEFHFQNSFRETSYHLPCFGAHHNVSTWEWWFHVFTDTYLKTMLEYDLPEDLVLDKIDGIVDELFYQVMVSPEAFELVPQVKVVLDTMAAWRDTRGGPKLAVVANDDERLHTTLENLGLLQYFDFVVTTRESGIETTDEELYDLALSTAKLENPRKAIHVGSSYDLDAVASCEAGWDACIVKPRQSYFEKPGELYEYHRIIRIGELLHRFDLPGADPEFLIRRRGNFWEEPNEADEDDPSILVA